MSLFSSTEFLKRMYRRVESRRLKAAALATMRGLGMKYMVVRLDTTNLCNLRCRMCYYSSEQARKPVEMSPELFEKIAHEMFPVTRFLYLSCATEPLMNKSFASFIETAASYKVPFVSFCTNGQLMSEKVAKAAVAGGVSEIIFSVDGATAETYEYIRRGAKWDRLLSGLEMLRKAKADAGRSLPIGRFNFTCMTRNIEELPEMVSLAAGQGIASVHVRHLLAFDDAGGGISCKEQMEYQRQFNALASQAQETARRLGVRLFLPQMVSQPARKPAAGNGEAPVGSPRRREANPYCLLPWFTAIITPAGDYRLCSAFRPFGNLRDQSFSEIYNGPDMRGLRKDLLSRSEHCCSWACRQEAYDASEKSETA